jgi:predicted enzyme related to lactoylglutathione lyase
MSRDYDASKAFYRAVFGYDYQDVSEGGFRYAMLMVDGREVGGIGQYEDGTPEGAPAAGRCTSPSTTPMPPWPG